MQQGQQRGTLRTSPIQYYRLTRCPSMTRWQTPQEDRRPKKEDKIASHTNSRAKTNTWRLLAPTLQLTEGNSSKNGEF